MATSPLSHYRLALHGRSLPRDGVSLPFTVSGEDPVCPRSALKPFVAYALVDGMRTAGVPLDPREIAVICSSHSGEAAHVALVREILRKGGLTEDNLQSGWGAPWLPHGLAPSPAFGQCAGQHAGLLRLARLFEADPSTYLRRDGIVHQAVYGALHRNRLLAPQEILDWRTDACNLPTPLMRGATLARLYMELAAGEDAVLTRIFSAMTLHPELVGGSHGRLSTELMKRGRVAPGDLVVKEGASGVLALGLKDSQAQNGRSFGMVVSRDPAKGPETSSRDIAWVASRTLGALGLIAEGWRQGIFALFGAAVDDNGDLR